MNKLVIEESQHPHTLEGQFKVIGKLENGITSFEVTDAQITHDEHHTIKLDAGSWEKVNLQELNPVTREIQNAFD